MTKVTPETFDRLVTPATRDSRKPEKLWGRPAIAAALGVSEDTVSKWSREDGVPIYQPRRGTYFALRSELEAWLRTKAA